MPPPRLISIHLAILLVIPQDLTIMAVSAGTELLLEPSGGRALLVEKSQVSPKPSEVSEQPEIIQVFPADTEETGGEETKVSSR